MKRNNEESKALLSILNMRALADSMIQQQNQLETRRIIRDISDAEIMLSSEAMREKLAQNARIYGNKDVAAKIRMMRHTEDEPLKRE